MTAQQVAYRDAWRAALAAGDPQWHDDRGRPVAVTVHSVPLSRAGIAPVDVVTYSGDCHVGACELCELPCDCPCHVEQIEQLIEANP